MNTRIAKKQAKAYLDGRLMPKARRTEDWCGNTDGRGVTKTFAAVNPRVERAILTEARRRGWDGCHWTNPLLLAVEPWYPEEEEE